jgi:transposase
LVFESFVPADHYLRKLKAAIDFALLRPLVADCYSPDQGRGAIDPVFLFKLSLLQFHYDLSDERIIQQAQVNLAFRFFLDLPAQSTLRNRASCRSFGLGWARSVLPKSFRKFCGRRAPQAWSKIACG